MKEPRLKLALLADGAHVNCQQWCEGLSWAGAEIHLLSFRVGSTNVEKTYQLPIPRLPGRLHYIAAAPYVRRLIGRIRPDVVIAYYVTGYGTLGALAGCRPLVQVTSGSDVLLSPLNPIMGRLVRFNLSRADLVTAWAPHMARAARELNVSEERIMVLPRGIPVDRFASSRRPSPTEGDALRIISTRSLKADYKTDLLLRAMSILRQRGMDFKLTLAGDGPQRQELLIQAQRLGIADRVHFAGFVANGELPDLLAQHDLYISVIGSDGVSASLLEAMAVGLLPIVPNNSANDYWIEHENNGLLLDDLTPASVAGAFERAFSDPDLRQGARLKNSEIIQRRADLFRNSEIYVEQFRRLSRDYHKYPGKS